MESERVSIYEFNEHCFTISLQTENSEEKIFSLLTESRLNLVSLTVEKTNFPNEIMRTLDQALECFSLKFVEIPKTEPKKVQSLTKDLHSYLETLLISVEISLEQLQSDLKNIFFSMHNFVDSIKGDILIELMTNLKNACKMPDEVTYQLFRKKKLVEADSIFYEKAIKSEITDIDDLRDLFESTYKELIRCSFGIEQEFSNYDQLIRLKKQQISKETCEKIVAAVKESVLLSDYCWIVFNKFSASGTLDKVNKGIDICLKPFDAILAKMMDFEIIQFLEVSPGMCIVFNAPGSGKSYVLLSVGFATRLKTVVDSDYIKIATGSTEENWVVLQNYPKRLTKMKINNGKLAIIKDYKVNLETYEYICEIVYIPHSNTIIFTTNDNEVFILKNEHIVNSLNHSQIFSMKYLDKLNLFAEIYANEIKLYDDNINLVKSFSLPHLSEIIIKQEENQISYVSSIQIQNIGNSLYVSNIVQNVICYFKLKLSAVELEDVKRDASILDKVVSFSKDLPGRVSLVFSDLIEKKSFFEDIKCDFQFGVYLERMKEERKSSVFLKSSEVMVEENFEGFSS